MKILWLNVVEAGAARIFSLLGGTVVLFLTARILGPERQGIIAAAVAWVSLFANFAGLSLGQVIHYRIQENKDQDWFPTVFGGLLFLLFVLSVTAYLLAFGVYQLSNGELFKSIPPVLITIAFALLPLVIWDQFSSNLLAAVGKLRIYNTAQYVGRAIWVLMTITLIVIMNFGMMGAILAQIMGLSIMAIIGFFALWKLLPEGVKLRKSEIKEMLKGSAKLHFNTVSAFLLSQTSILMLNHFATNAEVGWFQLAYQMVIMLLIIPQAASIAFFARMSEVGPNSLWLEQKNLIIQILGVIVLFSIMAYFVAPVVVLLAVGTDFMPAVKIFRSLLPVALGMSLAQLMTSQWIGRGAFLPTTIVTSCVAAANIAANAVLIPKFGMMGAVWASLVCNFGITVLVQAYYAWLCEKKSRQALRPQT